MGETTGAFITMKKPQKVKLRAHLIRTEMKTQGEKYWQYNYLGEKENQLLIVASDRKLPLGDNELVLEKSGWVEGIHTKQEVYLVLEQDQMTRKLWRDEYGRIIRVIRNPKSEEYNEIDERISSVQGGENYEEKIKILAMNDALGKIVNVRVSAPIDKAELERLTPEQRAAYIETHICGGYSIDPLLRILARAGLVKTKPYDGFEGLAKYRGHALVIKNTKTGMTSVASRVGLNVSAASFASLEGFAERQTGTNYSILHEQTGLINFDEFLLMKEGMVLKMYNFLEQGTYITGKNAQIIKNLSSAQCIFTANPSDFEMEAVDESTLTSSGIDPLLLAATFRHAIKLLSGTPKAMGSRFGMIVFNPEMKAAKMERQLKEDEAATARAVVESILEYKERVIRKLYAEPKIFNWLESPLPDYAAAVRKEAHKLQDFSTKAFWEGQTEAYRHIRGMALAEAVMDEVIIRGDEDIDAILESAEDSLSYICTENITSLKRMVEYAKDREITEGEIRNLRPAYLIPLLHTYAILTQDPERQEYSVKEILSEYHQALPEEQRRAMYPTYPYATLIERRLNKERAKRNLNGIVTVRDDGADLFFQVNGTVVKLREVFKVGVDGSN